MPTGVEGHIIDYDVRRDPSRNIGRSSIRFLYYEDLDTGFDPVYEEQSVRGRSEEHLFYSHTSGETYSFAIRLVSSVDEADGRTAKRAFQDYLFIKSFAYPDHGPAFQGPTLPPRKALITIGKWFKEVGVVKGPGATFSKTCDEDGYPHVIDVKFQFRITNTRPLSLRDIRKRAG